MKKELFGLSPDMINGMVQGEIITLYAPAGFGKSGHRYTYGFDPYKDISPRKLLLLL